MSLFRRSRKTLSIEQCAFSMMLAATADEKYDERSVRVVLASSALSRDSIRRELFFLRSFAVSAGVTLAIKDADVRNKVLQSFLVIMHLLAPQGQGSLPALEGLGKQDKLIYTVLMMRHMKLLEEYSQLDPRQSDMIHCEGASRFGTREFPPKHDAYMRVLASENIKGVGVQFASECNCPGDADVAEIGVRELQRFRTAMQEQLRSVYLTEQE